MIMILDKGKKKDWELLFDDLIPFLKSLEALQVFCDKLTTIENHLIFQLR